MPREPSAGATGGGGGFTSEDPGTPAAGGRGGGGGLTSETRANMQGLYTQEFRLEAKYFDVILASCHRLFLSLPAS